MRYAILSDVHANLHALLACVEAVRRAGVDRFVCAGDLVGHGPLPNECVDALAALEPVCVAGNHDLIALGRLSAVRCAPTARDSLNWTRSVLRQDTIDYLAALPTEVSLPGLLLTHGSPDNVEEYVESEDRARELLAAFPAGHGDAGLLVLGHTHQPWAFGLRRGTVLRRRTGRRDLPRDEPHLLNPGSVGQSRDVSPAARYLILDVETRRASFRSQRYDVHGCREALRRAGRPEDACHVKPDVAERARRVTAMAPAPVAVALRRGARVARRLGRAS